MEKSFAELTDRSRLDKLQAEILAFVRGFEDDGYTNLEIARELVGAAFKRAWLEPRSYLSESFYHHVQQTTARLIADSESLTREMAAEYEKNKVN